MENALKPNPDCSVCFADIAVHVTGNLFFFDFCPARVLVVLEIFFERFVLLFRRLAYLPTAEPPLFICYDSQF